jgi:hypothetical protein
MADLLPNNFPLPAENVISTYQYNDIADGTGIVNFYFYKASDKDGDVYKLGTEVVPSEEIEVLLQNDAPKTYTFYSGQFNTPRILKGNIIITWSQRATGNGANDTTSWKVYHYDGSTSTQIGDTYSFTTNDNADKVAIIPITTEVNFKIGDSIKVELLLSGGTAGRTTAWGIDPEDRDGTYVIPSTQQSHTASTIRIPFKIEV